MRARDHDDLPGDVDLERYPPYFRRNFHWQSDGYLSCRSAELYDLTVELLFAGTADVMRRQVIPPVSRVVGDGARSDVRLLDVACGTGRTLVQIARAHPRLRLYGLDLSPYYLQVARRVLADVPDVSLVADNAERLPFRSGYFDVVTSRLQSLRQHIENEHVIVRAKHAKRLLGFDHRKVFFFRTTEANPAARNEFRELR